ncbi:hypothetical protein D3C84_662050 [compost metagenome]
MAQGLAPRQRGHFSLVFQAVEGNHRHRHDSQQDEGDDHPGDHCDRQALGRMAETTGHFRHHVLRREAEHGNVEHRNHVDPAAVEQVAEVSFFVDQGRCNQHQGHRDHADADELLALADGLQAQVQHQGRRDEEQQAAQGRADAEELTEDLAAAAHVGDQCADAVDRHRQEDRPGTDRADIALGQAAQLMMAAGAQGRFGNVEHGDCGENARHRQPEQQRHVAGLAAGIGHRQYTSTNVGTHDHCNSFDECQPLDLKARRMRRLGRGCAGHGNMGGLTHEHFSLFVFISRCSRTREVSPIPSGSASKKPGLGPSDFLAARKISHRVFKIIRKVCK